MKACSLPVLLLTCVLSGCAAIVVERATSDSQEGVRFYRPDMYVLVSYEVTSECVVNVKQEFRPLPNKKEQYIVRTSAGIGSVTFNPTFTDGWNLTTFSATVDSKATEAITAITGAVTAVRAPAVAASGGVPGPRASVDCTKQINNARKATQLPPGLYRLDYDEATGYVKGYDGPMKQIPQKR